MKSGKRDGGLSCTLDESEHQNTTLYHVNNSMADIREGSRGQFGLHTVSYLELNNKRVLLELK